MISDIKAVIFDMGGVLLRTVDPTPRENMAARFNTTRKKLEQFIFMSPTSVQSEKGLISDTNHWQTVLDHFQQKGISVEEAYAEFFSGDQIDHDLLNFADSLKPEYKIGLLSNAWVNARQHLSKRYKFIDVFDVSIFSAEVGSRKPEERIYLIMLETLGVSVEQAIFIDDVPENVEGARKIGIFAIPYINRVNLITQLHNCLKK